MKKIILHTSTKNSSERWPCRHAMRQWCEWTPLQEGGQSGRHSFRLDFSDTFLSRKKYQKKVRFFENGNAGGIVGSGEIIPNT